jgi:hypothetical protein
VKQQTVTSAANSSPSISFGGVCVVHESPGAKPTTHQGDLAKLPRALMPLIERPQWAVWRWTRQTNDRWQKPPYQARDPQRHASTRDRSTWSDYATALATVQAGDADGISYVLTENDPLAAIDLDHCRESAARLQRQKRQPRLSSTATASTVADLATPSNTLIRLYAKVPLPGLIAATPFTR